MFQRSLLAVVTLALFSGSVAANSPLEDEIGKLAKDLKQLLDQQGQTSVAVGQFSGPPNFPTASGPGIAHTLTEELKKLGLAVKARAKLGVKGEYKVVGDNPASSLLEIEIVAVVTDGFGKQVDNSTRKCVVRNEKAIVQLIGASVELPSTNAAPPNKTRDQAIRDAYVEPKTHLAGARINAAAGGKFGMELVVDGQPRSAADKDGLAFVPIQRGETYAVRVFNDSELEVGVQLKIDGLNSFSFSELKTPEGKPLYSLVIIPPKSSFDFKGWHRTNEHSDSFQVTSYAKSAAASINHQDRIGVITATFAAAWPEEQPPPADEPPGLKDLGGDATGFGPRVEQKFQEVRRRVGHVRASISARYTK